MRGVAIFAAVAGSVSLLMTGILAPSYFGFALAAFAALLCIGLSGLDPTRLCCAFLVFSVVAHTLKRAIFLLGEQTSGSYYALVVAPVCLIVVLLFIVLLKRRFPLPPSAFVLLAFIMVAGLTTLLQSQQFGAAAALFTYLTPTLVFFVGLSLPDHAVGPLSRTAVRLGFASLSYGLWQFVGGPTFIDRAWAENAQDLSTQAAKVFDNMYQGNRVDNLFRPHSLHSDPFAWALSLSTMLALLGMSQSRGLRSRWFVSGVVIALLGLPLCLSRSPIVGFVAMIFLVMMVRKHYFRSAGLISLILALAGVVAVSGSQYLVDNYASFDSQEGSVQSRYLTVGTLSARTGAGDYLMESLREYPLVGAGLGASSSSSTRDSSIAFNDIAGSHNIVVDMFFTSGGLGAVLFFGFVYLVISEVFAMCRRRKDPEAFRVGSWALGATAGFLLTGFVSGAAFMNYDFFLLAGLGAGWAARRRFAPNRRFVANPAWSTGLDLLTPGQSSRKYAN